MQTLYDVLGLSRQATEQQIEHAYKLWLDRLTSADNNETVEMNAIRGKAIKEAYSILSSPIRRQNYDAKLNTKQVEVSYQVVEKAPIPWIWIVVGAIVLGGGFLYYKQQQQKAEMVRQAITAIQAKAEAERAEQEAIAEQTRNDRQKMQDEKQADMRRDAEMNTARREAQIIHYQNQRTDDQIAREKVYADQRAAMAQANEARLAKSRSDAETYAMRRALAIPISRSNAQLSQ